MLTKLKVFPGATKASNMKLVPAKMGVPVGFESYRAAATEPLPLAPTVTLPYMRLPGELTLVATGFWPIAALGGPNSPAPLGVTNSSWGFEVAAAAPSWSTTMTCAVCAVRVAGTSAVSCMLETKCVGSAAPSRYTTEPAEKSAPLTVRLKALFDAAPDGVMPLVDGGLDSKAPLPQLVSPAPGRGKPRWSVLGQLAAGITSRAGLPAFQMRLTPSSRSATGLAGA